MNFRFLRDRPVFGEGVELGPSGQGKWWGHTTVGSLAGGQALEIAAPYVGSGSLILTQFRPTSVVAATPNWGVCSVSPGSSFAICAQPSLSYAAQGVLSWVVLNPAGGI